MAKLYVKLTHEERHNYWVELETIEKQVHSLKGILQNAGGITFNDVNQLMKDRSETIAKLSKITNNLVNTLLSKFR